MRENVMPRQLSHSASTSSVCMQGSDPRAIRRNQIAGSANHQWPSALITCVNVEKMSARDSS